MYISKRLWCCVTQGLIFSRRWKNTHAIALIIRTCSLSWYSFLYSRCSDNNNYPNYHISESLNIYIYIYMMSSTITMPIGGWLQTFNDFFCFTFSLKPNLCLQVKLFLLIIVKAKNQKTTLLSLRKYPWKMKNRANFGCNA